MLTNAFNALYMFMICSNHFDFFLKKKNVHMAGKNLLVRLHAIVLIVFQEKRIMVLLLAVRLVDRLNFIFSFSIYYLYRRMF